MSSPVSLLLTPTASLGSGTGGQNPLEHRAAGHGPTLADQVEHLATTPRMQPPIRNVTCPAGICAIEVVDKLLPTPLAGDGVKGSPRQMGSKGDLSLPSAVASLSSRQPEHHD
ncbi:hypothetical protein [Kitasatospora azatica]|uniref:hypothetical protein n=1 Tax=Kitasatospora azatica TaxID=58347 RepID=UPI00068F3D12|nr:hypothetical protein [Kitasatospora azatica]